MRQWLNRSRPHLAKPDLAILIWPHLAKPNLAIFFFGGGPKGWGPEGLGARLAAWGPPGLHTTAREPKRAHLSAPAFKNTTKIQREDPPEREERMRFPVGERKKRAKFWAVQGKGGPAEEGVRGAPPGVQRRGPKILKTPTKNLEDTTRNLEHTNTQHTPHTIEYTQHNTHTAKTRTPILSKCGLAKCGHENDLAKFGFFWPNAVWPNADMTVEYHPISMRDQSRLQQFGKKVLPGIFLGSALIAGRIGKETF